MSKTPLLIFGAFVALVAVIGYLAFAKEGSEGSTAVPVDSADQEAQEVFADKCGACHTLAAGGTDGVVGPNLDEIIPTSPAPAEGTPEDVAEASQGSFDAAYSRVLNAVTCGLEGRMPAGILEGALAQDVSGFVAAYAGQLADDQGPLIAAADRDLAAPQPCPTGGASAPAN